MADSLLIDKAVDELGEFLEVLIPDSIANAFGKRKIADINKRASEMNINLYAVASDNINPSVLSEVKMILEAKYAAVVATIAEEIISSSLLKGKDPRKALKSRLANSDIGVDNSLGKVFDKLSFGESIIFKEESLCEAGRKDDKSGSGSSSSMNSYSKEFISFKKVQYLKDDREVIEELKKRIVSDPIFAKKLKAIDNDTKLSLAEKQKAYKALNGEANKELDELKKDSINVDKVNISLKIKSKVNAMPIEASKIIELVGTTTDRSILFNYLKMRAGTNELFKDFILNLKEISKSVDRDTSLDLQDRILSSMVRKGGHLIPQIFSEISEAKYYILIMDKIDKDTLKDKYGFDLSKTNYLRLLFEKYNILSLAVVDQVKKDVCMFDSDDPIRMDVINYGKHTEKDELFSVFSTMMRK